MGAEVKNFLRTVEVWDPYTWFHKLFNNWFNRCERERYGQVVKAITESVKGFYANRGSVRVFCPGVGRGRLLRPFLLTWLQESVPVEVVAVDTDYKSLGELERWLKKNKFQKLNLNERIWTNAHIKVVLVEERVENYLASMTKDIRWDVIICLLFLHHVSYCWLSIVREFYHMLSEEGILVVDEISATNPEDQEFLRAFDSDAHMFTRFPKQLSNKANVQSWRAYYLDRLYREHILWGSPIKGTNIDLFVHCVSPLFEVHRQYRIKDQVIALSERHLPWVWGSSSATEPVPPNPQSGIIAKLRKDRFKAGFNIHVFQRKREIAPSYWDACHHTIAFNLSTSLNAVLWMLTKNRFESIRSLAHETLPSVVCQLIACSGLFDYDSEITSLFIAQGSIATGLRVPRLQHLYLLLRDDDENWLKFWLVNYYIYSRILKPSLSEGYMRERRPTVLHLGKEEVEWPAEWDVKGLKSYGQISDIHEQIIKGIERNVPYKYLLRWKLTTFDLRQAFDIDAKQCEFIEGVVKELTRDVHEGETKLGPIRLLISQLGSLVFIPFASFYEQRERSEGLYEYETHCILGIGITVRSLKKALRRGGEIDRIRAYGEILLRRFQDVYLGLHWVEEAYSFALRSAVAAIMSRNMSHNIGSHVLARIVTGGIDGWTQGLGVEEIVDKLTVGCLIKQLDEALSTGDRARSQGHDPCQKLKEALQQYKGCQDRERYRPYVTPEQARSLVTWGKDVQILARYLQQRMDFIAQVSTEWPTWSEPSWFMRDMMRWFLSQRHLLDYIARSDGLQAHLYEQTSASGSSQCESTSPPTEESSAQDNATGGQRGQTQGTAGDSQQEEKLGDIRLHVFLVPEECWEPCGDRQPQSVHERKNQIEEHCYNCKSAEQLGCPRHRNGDTSRDCHRILLYTPGDGSAECCLDEDFLVAIPGGVVGQHAFFTILENIIRNAAKHGYSRQSGRSGHLDVVIEVLYDPEEKVAIRNEVGDQAKRIPARLFRIYTNVSPVDGQNAVDLSKINGILGTGIIKETGEMEKANWGHAEMKVAAGYLQRRDILHIGGKGQEITGDRSKTMMALGQEPEGSRAIIRAVKSPIATLGYEFCIPRPRVGGIVCPEGGTSS